MKKVTVIGSCRIHEPMKSMSKTGKISLNNIGTTGYVHSLGEVIQLLSYLRGDETIPNDIIPFIPPEIVTDIFRFSPTLHEETDFFIIEICSIKEFTIKHSFVQMNILFQELKKIGHENSYFKFCSNMNKNQGVWVPFRPQAFDLSESISSLKGISLTEAQVCRKVENLQKKLAKPFAIVTHIEMPGHHDDPTVGLYRRSDGIRYLRNAGKKLGIPVIEPGELVAAEKNILQQGSSNHYNPEYHRLVGEWILLKIRSHFI